MKYHLYCRVSHKSQNLASQIRTLKESYPEGELYQEKLSGISKTRPERDRMIASLEPGDCVVCIRMSRLSRSMTDLFNVVEQIAVKGANIRFIHENIDTTTSHGRLVFVRPKRLEHGSASRRRLRKTKKNWCAVYVPRKKRIQRSRKQPKSRKAAFTS
jgi:hypothetical protein